MFNKLHCITSPVYRLVIESLVSFLASLYTGNTVSRWGNNHPK